MPGRGRSQTPPWSPWTDVLAPVPPSCSRRQSSRRRRSRSSARETRSPSSISHHAVPRSPSPSLASCTRSLRAARPASSGAVRMRERALPSSDFSGAVRRSGSAGSMARHRRPPTMMCRPSGVRSGPLVAFMVSMRDRVRPGRYAWSAVRSGNNSSRSRSGFVSCPSTSAAASASVPTLGMAPGSGRRADSFSRATATKPAIEVPIT